jgi:hypothetical protein
MSISIPARKLVPISSVLAIATLVVAGGCAPPAPPAEGESEGIVQASASRDCDDDGTSGSINGWTITSHVRRSWNGNLIASATLDDNGTGGGRSAAACLVVDLGLGRCDTQANCDAAATAAGYPASVNGPNGWQHFCRPAGDGTRNRCWTRPGPAYVVAADGTTEWRYCKTNALRTLSGTTLTIEHAPTSDDVALPPRREWTALACLAGGLIDPALPPGPGNTIGNPAACATQDYTTGAFVLDDPITVRK